MNSYQKMGYPTSSVFQIESFSESIEESFENGNWPANQ